MKCRITVRSVEYGTERYDYATLVKANEAFDRIKDRANVGDNIQREIMLTKQVRLEIVNVPRDYHR